MSSEPALPARNPQQQKEALLAGKELDISSKVLEVTSVKKYIPEGCDQSKIRAIRFQLLRDRRLTERVEKLEKAHNSIVAQSYSHRLSILDKRIDAQNNTRTERHSEILGRINSLSQTTDKHNNFLEYLNRVVGNEGNNQVNHQLQSLNRKCDILKMEVNNLRSMFTQLQRFQPY